MAPFAALHSASQIIPAAGMNGPAVAFRHRNSDGRAIDLFDRKAPPPRAPWASDGETGEPTGAPFSHRELLLQQAALADVINGRCGSPSAGRFSLNQPSPRRHPHSPRPAPFDTSHEQPQNPRSLEAHRWHEVESPRRALSPRSTVAYEHGAWPSSQHRASESALPRAERPRTASPVSPLFEKGSFERGDLVVSAARHKLDRGDEPSTQVKSAEVGGTSPTGPGGAGPTPSPGRSGALTARF